LRAGVQAAGRPGRSSHFPVRRGLVGLLRFLLQCVAEGQEAVVSNGSVLPRPVLRIDRGARRSSQRRTDEYAFLHLRSSPLLSHLFYALQGLLALLGDRSVGLENMVHLFPYL